MKKNEKTAAGKATQSDKTTKVLDPATLKGMQEALLSVFGTLKTLLGAMLPPEVRKRMYGPGTRLYGFIEKVRDISVKHLQFAPSYYGDEDINSVIHDIEDYRNLLSQVKEIEGVLNDLIRTKADKGYHLALLYYNSVHQMAKSGAPGAQAVYEMLSDYFEKDTTPGGKATKKQFTRDFRALQKGTKDGKMVIENIRPQLTGGVHKEIDHTTSEHIVKKTTDEEEA